MEAGTNFVGWFVSAMLGCQLLHLFIGPFVHAATGTKLRAILGIVLALALRIALFLGTLASDWDERHASSTEVFFDWTSEQWVLHNYPAYLAGVCTARLYHHLPADGAVRQWRGWLFADTPAFLSLLLLPRVDYVSTATVKHTMTAFLLTPLFCYICFLCVCKHHGLTMRVFAHPAFSSLAPYSYATYLLQVYLLHYPRAEWRRNPMTAISATSSATCSTNSSRRRSCRGSSAAWSPKAKAPMDE